MYLNCKTYFSFKYGTFSTEELVQAAVDRGVTALTLTNINHTYDAWNFVKLCRQSGIKPIVGVEVRNDRELCYILIAANNKGLAWIHGFLSEHLINKKPFPLVPESCFTDHWDGFVIYPLGRKQPEDLLPNEYIGIRAVEVNKLYGTSWKTYSDKYVICQPVTIQDKPHYDLHRLLRAIDKNVLLSKLEKEDCCSPDEIFNAPDVLLRQFQQYPFLVTNTYRLMDACRIEMEFHTDKTKRVFGGSEEDDTILLEKLATDGLKRRYGERRKVAAERLRSELQTISKLGFTTYFLINYDFVRYAQSQGFYYVGRGSGANSIVAYCLGITDVDPIELNLYFERFLNPERTSPPDFDIDFSWTDRDEVIDYIFKRHGKRQVALLGSFSTFKHDSIIFQLGKVFGLPPEEIKNIQRTNQVTDNYGRWIARYGAMMQGFPSHASLHPCGMLISERAILEYTTLFMPPKGFLTAYLDMFSAEDIGLNKFDVLSQRGLGHIREAQRLVKLTRGEDINVHNFAQFRHDEKIKAQIRTANTIGCFYIESPAMRQLLKKLRCDDYLTLVAASSIIRPGVAQSGMMREYIFRYHNRDKIRYLHPLFEEHMAETFGVMVFQEDVIKIAHYYAGLSLGKADILRRAMSGKYRSSNQFQLIREEFFASALALGRPEELSAEIWRQMESFAGYSFNKAHSASFAVESYMSLYLKTYFPKEFMVAVINNFGGFYSTELYFLELLRIGVPLQAPCVNRSEELTSILGDDVFCGFVHLKGFQKNLMEEVLEERKKNGVYLHLQDFIERIHPGLEQLNMLISIGAFRFTGKSKKTLLWEANFLQKKHQPVAAGTKVLFEEKPLVFTLPELQDYPIDDLFDQMEILGFMLTNPFELADADPNEYVAARDIEKHQGKMVTVLAYFIARKHVATKNNQEMFFGTFVDNELEWIDTVHFPEVAKRYPLHTSGFYRISGKVVEDFGVYSIEVQKLIRVGYKKRKYANL